MAAEMKDMSYDEIMYLIHHIFLPPKFPPQEGDYNSNHENVLYGIVDSVIAMIANLRTVREGSSSDDSVSEERLENALKNICSNGGMIPLHIRAQNAGILISKVDNSVKFELFELSPLNQSVITTKGRLSRSFPGPVFSLSIDKFQAPDFKLRSLVHSLRSPLWLFVRVVMQIVCSRETKGGLGAASESLERVYDVSHESCSEIIAQTSTTQRSSIYTGRQNLSSIT
ncbi:hypothetical protein ACJ73_06032 [Blastomyces percursus]|uniref:DUF6606 domain-containing protein n=1 Tax=Blastomyces percursus TaxID=1658174 RepID=A0A1J9Q3F4_9EURO|nr:hypothetical protein ACJ73_06032 [Blastomyces percursus]